MLSKPGCCVTSSASSSNRFPELERFELIEEVGHGGMATVYRARDLRLGREVAVKVIHKHLRQDPEVRRRFVSEARAVAKLKHRGIVEVYDVSDESDEERYLVVELINGMSLRQVLQDQEVLPPEVAASLVSLLCEAVQHAHDCAVIHRDIKPENVLIGRPRVTPTRADGEPDTEPDSGSKAVAGRSSPRREGKHRPSSSPPSGRVSNRSATRTSSRTRVIVKLTDFGIAKVLDIQGMTSTGQILGSPAHMAPEQIEGGKVGPHTDVFALGVLFYECMVGHLPFEGRNPAQVLRRVLDGSFEQADRERPVVGGRWAKIIAGALSVDVEGRTGSAEQLGALINAELSVLGVADPRSELAAYFADPKGYRKKAAEQLVPRLLERGERERRQGSVHGAAADFNRALAYRPDDLTILRRVSSLTARRLWRQRAIWFGGIVGASLALGGTAYSVARLLKPGEGGAGRPGASAGPTSSARAARPVASLSASATGSAGQPNASSGPDAPTAYPSLARPPRIASVRPPGPVLSALPAATTRRVRFAINPGAAKLALDGAEAPWMGTKDLTLGAHSVRAWMKASDPCCKEISTTVMVLAPPEDQPEAVQIVPINLPIKDASATLPGAPLGGIVTCGNGLTVASGGSGRVRMTDVEWRGTCTFNPGGKTRGVVLRAGVTTPIAWPGD